MSDRVISLSDKTNNGSLRGPVETLEEALKELRPGGDLEEAKKVLVITLKDDDQYTVHWFQGGMKMSQCVSLCEVAKTMFLQQMEYIPND